MRASYKEREGTAGPINYENKYCAAKSAGII